jgi:hypothetical protein
MVMVMMVVVVVVELAAASQPAAVWCVAYWLVSYRRLRGSPPPGSPARGLVVAIWFLMPALPSPARGSVPMCKSPVKYSAIFWSQIKNYISGHSKMGNPLRCKP